VKLFLGFVLVSGIGWLLDLLSYTILTQAGGFPPSCANFVSSMAGVTYVWFVSLNRLFNRGDYGKSIFLPIYWVYQAVSIFLYSVLIAFVAASRFNSLFGQWLNLPVEVMAKILITPVNLLTNFIFMTILTKFMKTPDSSDGV
jgi:putative flippase GtrA